MSSNSVEDEIVSMKFDNNSFNAGVRSTIETLSKLKSSLNFSQEEKSVNDLETTTKRFSLQSMSNNIQKITDKFGLMQRAGLIAMNALIRQGFYKLEAAVSSFTIDPILDGFKNYQDQINATKTILSNVKASGANLSDVTKVLNQMQKYAQLTVYNFGEMAKSVGTFTAAGVALKPAAQAIKGIANLAALSGSSSQQASSAMYQLSQAIAAGQVKLQDWNSVVNAGIAGPTFQRALAETAVALGKLPASAVKLSGAMKTVSINGLAFRNSLSPKKGQLSWLTSDVLTKTLAEFTGDMKESTLVAEGFTAQQAKAVIALGKTALASATQVKTWDQLTQALKEEVGAAYGRIFKALFGDLPQATKLFSALHQTLENLLTNGLIGFSKTLETWNKLGGQTDAIGAITDAWKDLGEVLKPIQQAFREIFPKETASNLLNMTADVEKFFQEFKMGATYTDNLKRTFAGLFAAMDIVWQVVKNIVVSIASLFGATANASGGILEFTGNIGDWLVKLDKAIKAGNGLTTFFQGLTKAIEAPIKLIGEFGHLLSVALTDVGPSLAQAIKNTNFQPALAAVNTGLLAGIVLLIHNFFKKGAGITVSLKSGIFGQVEGVLGGLTETLETMQQNVKSNILLKIATSVGLLAGSVLILSTINGQKMSAALSGLTVAFTELMASMAILTKITATAGFIKIPIISASLVMLSGAVVILSGAMKLISTMSWDQIARGLTGISGVIVALVGMSTLLSANKGKLLSAGVGLTALSVAVRVLASSVAALGKLDYTTLTRGLTGVAGSMIVLAGAVRIMPKNMPATGAGIILIAAGLKTMAIAVSAFSALSFATIGRGLADIGAALVVIGGAMHLMPKGMLVDAAALVVVAHALNTIGTAVEGMGKQSWSQIGKGITVLASSLAVLAGGLYLMQGTLLASASLVVAAAALKSMGETIKTLGTLPIKTVAEGLGVLAASMLVFGGLSAALSAVLLPMLGIGAAMALFGGGLAAAGVGIQDFAKGITLLLSTTKQGAQAFANLGKDILLLVPNMVKALATGLLDLVKEILQGAPVFVKAFETLLDSLLTAITDVTPKLAQAMNVLLTNGLKVIDDNDKKIINTGIKIVTDLLQGISKNAKKIATAALGIVSGLLNGIANGYPKILAAAANIIINLVQGLAKQGVRLANAAGQAILTFLKGLDAAINKYEPQIIAEGVQIGGDLIKGLIKGLAPGVSEVGSKIKDIADGAVSLAKKIWGIRSPSKVFQSLGEYINQGLVKGLTGSQSEVTDAFNRLKDDIKGIISSTSESIKTEKNRLDSLLSAKTKNYKSIAEAQQALTQAQKDNATALAAQKTLNTELAAHQKTLEGLSKEYDKITDKLKTAQQALKDAKNQMATDIKDYTDQYDSLPDITAPSTTTDDNGNTVAVPGTSLAQYEAGIVSQQQAVAQYGDDLKQLLAEGLDTTTYKKLLDDGTVDQDFVNQLLAGGQAAINLLNQDDAALQKAAGDLANQAGTTLDQAGVDAAQQVVNGLQSQQKAVSDEAKKIAQGLKKALNADIDTTSIGKHVVDGIISGMKSKESDLAKASANLAKVADTATKKQAQINSPSKVFYESGAYMAQGLANGLTDYSTTVSKSATSVVDNVVATMKTSIASASKTISDTLNTNPTITPVLDLTQLQKQAATIGTSLTPTVSLSQAESISANTVPSATDSTGSVQNGSESSGGTTINFQQTNNSPKALSPAEVYRRTKNLLNSTADTLGI